MSRNLAALGALAVAGLLWVVLAWPASEDASSAAFEPESAPPAAPAAPPPSAAGPAAAPSTAAPAKAAEPATLTAEATPPAAAAAEPTQDRDPIQGDQGPVEEYRTRFESEPRDSVAPEFEAHVRGAFEASGGGRELFKSVLCRESICKVEMRWSTAQMRPYINAVRHLGVGSHVNDYTKHTFAPPLALSPGPKDEDGTRLVELYLKRKAPTKSPEHAQ